MCKFKWRKWHFSPLSLFFLSASDVNCFSVTVLPVFITEICMYGCVRTIFHIRRSFNFFDAHTDRAGKWFGLLFYFLSHHWIRLFSDESAQMVYPVRFVLSGWNLQSEMDPLDWDLMSLRLVFFFKSPRCKKFRSYQKVVSIEERKVRRKEWDNLFLCKY